MAKFVYTMDVLVSNSHLDQWNSVQIIIIRAVYFYGKLKKNFSGYTLTYIITKSLLFVT